MKGRIKLTESQLKKVISKIIREELINELEHSTMQNALLKTKHDKNRQGQHNRMAKNYGDRFFQQFEGRDLLGYRIRKININVGEFDSKFNQKDMSDVDFDKSFDIFVEIGGGKMITIKYDHKSDSINVDGDDIKTFQVSRKDAILLSKMISGYAVGSKYKVNNIHQNFLLRNNMQEAKLNKIIEQHIRKALSESLENTNNKKLISKEFGDGITVDLSGRAKYVVKYDIQKDIMYVGDENDADIVYTSKGYNHSKTIDDNIEDFAQKLYDDIDGAHGY